MTEASKPLRHHKIKHVLQGVVLFAVLAALVHFAFETERDRIEQNLRTRVTQDAIGIAARLETELNANVFLAHGMVAFVTAVQTPSDAEFTAALKAMYQFGRHVRNVGAAPDNRISHVYPLEGNEAALGLNYPDIPDQWTAVKKAIERRTTLLAGPIQLRQGGTGFISRTPVFFEDGHYWGILSLVLDSESLFKEARLAPEANGIQFAMRGKDGAGERGAVFFGDASTFGPDSVKVSISVPGGAWVIAAKPRGGWVSATKHLTALEIVALVAALLPALLFFQYQRNRLGIAASEQRLRAFMETARDGVVVIDDSGLIHEFNRAAESLFGYAANEVVGTSLNRLMPEREAKQHDDHLRNPHHSGVRTMAKGRQIVGLRKDGSTFPAEITVGNARVEDKCIYVGVVRDITERKAFEQQLIDLASTDGLTGALTRRAFMEEASNLFLLARRHARPLSLLMVDADYFKKVNDTYGHHVGDVVLVRLVAIFKEYLRTTDKVGRMGGEEFVVLLPETGPEEAAVVAERLLRAVRETKIDTDSGAALKITVSIGLAALSAQTKAIEALLRQADEALYDAKAGGRNRVCTAGATT
jgi:diguanylate cyclase (GGDEF)-like protein/PAS domain S-box-containing protein